ncbi:MULTISPECIES: tRNA adenosine(34) deaminase TadA [unclassified Thioalkalivibrio]|uniref:tRNA adenosine(34) deaminase TadA n=1 Tax=unclassified Thioalkalivibrio TaxID=2621013 RepID=UPI000379A4A2|nr:MULTISPECIES: tRNA adenosine(34) deaminase TadA [unclassified Thioalkalivibrio]
MPRSVAPGETGPAPDAPGAADYWMERALSLADRAAAVGEVPVGAVLVDADGTCLAACHNAPIALHDPTAHAEIRALREAGERLQNYRLPGTTLYVTLEPCSMCAGAMIHARVAHLVYGAPDPRTGAAGSALDLIEHPAHNHRLEVTGGILGEEAAEQLRRFFRARR